MNSEREPAPASLGELYARLSEELGSVTTATTEGVTAYRRGAREFAVVDGSAVEVRLQPEVAEAVLRTPRTSRSRRGQDWVRFDPPEVEPSVVDRADAWFRSAWRLAEG